MNYDFKFPHNILVPKVFFYMDFIDMGLIISNRFKTLLSIVMHHLQRSYVTRVGGPIPINQLISMS
jgi:hypothetical protein